MEKRYTLDGFSFLTAADLERAKKEKETILYLKANTDMTDMKAVYKLYKLSVEKQSFQTIFGFCYLEELRERLVGSGAVTEDMLEPIPVGKVALPVKHPEQGEAEKEIQKYKEDFQKAKAGSLIKKFLIVVLLFMVAAMVLISSNNRYSLMTFFTNYKEEMRNEIVDELEQWELQLNEREDALNEKEQILQQKESAAE